MNDKPMPQTISFLLAQVCKAHRGCASEALNEVGLHVGQEMFLMQLWQQDGLTQSQLAEHMCVQPPTVNKMLSRMEIAGLVVRREDQDDSRISRVYLADRSRQLKHSVEQVWDSLESRTVAKLSSDEQDSLRQLLLKVYENLTETVE